MNHPSTSLSNILSTSCVNFPTEVLKWMKANAQPLMTLKLMQVCKYFQHKKFPYLVFKGLMNNDGRWKCFESYNNELPSKPVLIIKGTQKMMETPPIDLHVLPDCSLWIVEHLSLSCAGRFASILLPKLAVCQAREFCLYLQNLTLHEFKILTSCKTFEHVQIQKTSITDLNDEVASFESVIECLPNVRRLIFETNVPPISSSTLQEIPILAKLDSVQAEHLFEDFDFNGFLLFMKVSSFLHEKLKSIEAHPSAHFHISFDFQSNLSLEYKNRIEEYIYRFLAEERVDKFPPWIDFPSETCVDALVKLQERYREFRFSRCK